MRVDSMGTRLYCVGRQQQERRAVTIWINGQAREVPEGITLTALLASLEVGGPGVAVEVNAEVVRRARHPEYQLSPQDRVEIVTFVGGG